MLRWKKAGADRWESTGEHLKFTIDRVSDHNSEIFVFKIHGRGASRQDRRGRKAPSFAVANSVCTGRKLIAAIERLEESNKAAHG